MTEQRPDLAAIRARLEAAVDLYRAQWLYRTVVDGNDLKALLAEVERLERERDAAREEAERLRVLARAYLDAQRVSLESDLDLGALQLAVDEAEAALRAALEASGEGATDLAAIQRAGVPDWARRPLRPDEVEPPEGLGEPLFRGPEPDYTEGEA